MTTALPTSPDQPGLSWLGRLRRLDQTVGPPGYRLYHRLLADPLAVLGIGLLLFFVFVALLAPIIAPPVNPHQPYLIPRDGFSATPRPPGSIWKIRPPPLPLWWKPILGTEQWVHLLGTTDGQWDIFYGIVWGTRTALTVGLLIESVTLAIGLLVGSVAGFYDGWLDEGLMRLTDIFLAFPALLAALTLSLIFTPLLGKSIWPILLALMVFGWMGYARLIRGDILAVRERDFILAIRAVGASRRRILFRHIVPNALYPTLVVATLNIGNDVLIFTSLSFLGIGPEIGYADWGQLIGFGRNWLPALATYWWVVIWPGLALLLFALGWNLVGDALRDL